MPCPTVSFRAPLVLLASLTLLLLSHTPAQAALAWSGSTLPTRMDIVGALALGLVVELPFVKWAFETRWIESVVATVAINLVSFGCWLALLPLASYAWTGLSGVVEGSMPQSMGRGLGIVGTALLVIVVNVFIELRAAGFMFKLPRARGQVKRLFIANALSLTLISLLSLPEG